VTAQPADLRDRGLFHGLLQWARAANLERKLALAFLVLGLSAGTATFGVMTGDLPIAANSQVVLLLLVADLFFLLGLSALIARRLTVLWLQRKRGYAGVRLHSRLVALFSLVAVMPTILVATFSVMLFDFGLKVWFSEQVSTAIKNSLAVAQAYTEEHRQTISADALAIAQVLNRGGPTLVYNPRVFNQVITGQANQRSLTEAAVYDSTGRLLARASNFLLAFNPQLPDWALEKAAVGELVILTSGSDDRVRALVRLDGFSDAYLYIGRLIDSRVIGHLDRTQGAVQLYEELEGDRYDLQITFALIFAVVAMMLLLAAIWVGLAFANHLTVPISSLILAAEKVGAGDLSARALGSESQDEIGSLSRAFNRMTGRIESQQHELLEANRLLDYRSRFIEAVVGGVSAGVIGLDRDGNITLPNRSACELLEFSAAELRGRNLADLVPEMAELLKSARRWPDRIAEKELSLFRRDGTARELLARIAAESDDEGINWYVVTFDDITELLSAQRKAAWSDIARRIAHEIKNPLTPIQLSAERLKRKYLKQISDDPETFEICTDTIVRHVDDIGRMVDEFSSFARMPTPVMADEDLVKLIEEALFLIQNANPKIKFTKDLPDEPVVASCDREQIGRAITNILMNAVEAVAAQLDEEGRNQTAGRVRIGLADDGRNWIIEVQDNGPGLPKAELHRLTEPYVSTRDRGTGLGLAIVKKIMEEHGGSLILENHPEGGARVALRLPHEEEIAADDPVSDDRIAAEQGA
jgi:two-component system nitrogen regulation sensor histidine kinase NtrY